VGLNQQSGVPVQPLIENVMNELVNRRDILKYAALVPAVSLAALPVARAVAAGFVPIKRVPGARLKLAVNAFSFLELLVDNAKDVSKGIDLFGVCDFCAMHGCDGVDLTGYFFPGYPNAPDDDYLFKLKRHAFDCGLAITGTGVRNDFTAADKTLRAEGVQRIKTWIEVAAKLGAPVIRAFADSQPPYKNWHEAAGNANREIVESWMADALIECAEHGQKFGVIVAVQNHGDFINTGEQHLSLLKKVDHVWCAALVDTGKYLTDNPYADIELMAPYAVNWQIKETLGSRVDSPRTDMKRLVEIIRTSGYRGYLPIETLSMKRKNYDPLVEVPKLIAELRDAIGK
jgi:sugar phosphate isomerase/epimerase